MFLISFENVRLITCCCWFPVEWDKQHHLIGLFFWLTKPELGEYGHLSCTYLVVELQRSLVLTILADVGLSERGEVEVPALLRVQDHVASIGCVRKVLRGLDGKRLCKSRSSLVPG